MHPSLGFAPARLNTADALTRFKELPEAAEFSIPDVLSTEQVRTLHALQFSRPNANWIRLFILVSSCLGSSFAMPDGFQDAFHSSPPVFGLSTFPCWIFVISWIFCGLYLALCGDWHWHNFRPPIGPSNIYFAPLLALQFVGAGAMPLVPISADDRKRAGDRATVSASGSHCPASDEDKQG